MRLLALETSGRHGGVALAQAGAVLLERSLSSAGMRHGRDLLPAIRDAMDEAGWSPRDIDLVAMSIGPGSFTGLRIAVMFARILAWQTGVRVVTAPTLRVIAENAPSDRRKAAVVTDAQRGGVYWARYERDDDGALRCVSEEAVGPAEEAAGELSRGEFLLGDALEKHAGIFEGWTQGEAGLWRPRAAAVAEIGWQAHLRGEYVDVDMLEPLYVRRPAPEEVEERRKRGGR